MNEFISLMKCEFSNYPGRRNLMLRYLISSTIVIIISMTLNVPMLSFSMLVVFLATQQNVVLTKMVFPLFIFCATFSISCCIFMLKVTIDYPLIRLISLGGIMIILLYLSRSSKFGFIFSSTAIAITYVQSFVDLSSDGEMLVRNCLWTWVAGCYSAVVVYLVDTLILPTNPIEQLKNEKKRIVNEIILYLDNFINGIEVKEPEFDYIKDRGILLRTYLKYSIMKSSLVENDKKKHLSEIELLIKLYIAIIPLSKIKPGSIPKCQVKYYSLFLEECMTLNEHILNERFYEPSDRLKSDYIPECLQKIQFIFLNTFSDIFCNEVVSKENSNIINKSLSYRNIKYAIKTLFSVMLCYIFYTSVEWPGIHTSMLTCIIVALPGLGAIAWKSLLRIVGCLIGSILALTATVFIQPHFYSLTGLLVMVVPVIMLSGWICAGSNRINYAGLQLLFAFSLAMFTSFSPSPDLTEIRDRIFGIILGVIVSMLINIFIWPEDEGVNINRLFSDLFGKFALKVKELDSKNNLLITSEFIDLDCLKSSLEQLFLESSLHPSFDKRVLCHLQSVFRNVNELIIVFFNMKLESKLSVNKETSKPIIQCVGNELFLLYDYFKYFEAVFKNKLGDGFYTNHLIYLTSNVHFSDSINGVNDSDVCISETKTVALKICYSISRSLDEILYIINEAPYKRM